MRMHTLWLGPAEVYPELAAHHEAILAARREGRLADLPGLVAPAAALAGPAHEKLYRELIQRRDRRAGA